MSPCDCVLLWIVLGRYQISFQFRLFLLGLAGLVLLFV